MVTFTINIPQMLAYIYHTWILWVWLQQHFWGVDDGILGPFALGLSKKKITTEKFADGTLPWSMKKLIQYRTRGQFHPVRCGNFKSQIAWKARLISKSRQLVSKSRLKPEDARSASAALWSGSQKHIKADPSVYHPLSYPHSLMVHRNLRPICSK